MLSRGVGNVLSALCIHLWKADEQGKYIPLGCLGVHADDGIGGRSPEFMDMLKGLNVGLNLGHSRLDSSSILG